MTIEHDIQIIIDTAGDTAEVVIPAGVSPDAVTEGRLLAAAEAAGVFITPTVRTRIVKFVNRLRIHPDRRRGILASTTTPVHGRDGHLKWELDFDPKLKRLESTRVRRRATTPADAGPRYLPVEQGQHIATLLAPTAGNPGHDVFGREISANSGQPNPVRPGRGIVLGKHGELYAECDGTLQFVNNLISVETTISLSRVDYHTGNINANGSVNIEDDVCSLFSVRATGDITVGGLVEAATIQCGGDLACEIGIAGRDNAMISVEGCAMIGYLNNATCIIKRDLTLRREAIDSDITVDGNLRADEAAIIGGFLRVGGDVQVDALGSRGAKPTVIAPAQNLAANTIHHGVTLILDGVEARFRQDVTEPVTLQRNSQTDGWYLATNQGTAIQLDQVAWVNQRTAA